MLIAQAPLRISFLGGGSDFQDFYAKYGGAVLSTAINKYVFVVLMERFDDKIVLNYTDREIVSRVEDIKHGLIREAMKLTRVLSGVEITTLANIPSEGSGLGSSSAITVALVHALLSYQNKLTTQADLAEAACLIEIDRLHKPIGRQDQYIAAYGGIKLIRFNDKVEVEDVLVATETMHAFNEELMMFYTGRTRQADVILADQKNNIPQRIEVLKEMRSLAIVGKEALLKGNYQEMGRLLHENWELKKKLSDKISNPDIDEMYATARAAGALGGKLLGAGGSGFLLLYVPVEKKREVKNALRGYRQLRNVVFEPCGCKVIFDRR